MFSIHTTIGPVGANGNARVASTNGRALTTTKETTT